MLKENDKINFLKHFNKIFHFENQNHIIYKEKFYFMEKINSVFYNINVLKFYDKLKKKNYYFMIISKNLSRYFILYNFFCEDFYKELVFYKMRRYVKKIDRMNQIKMIFGKIKIKKIFNYRLAIYNYKKIKLQNGSYIKFKKFEIDKKNKKKKKIKINYKNKIILYHKILKIKNNKKTNYYILTLYKNLCGDFLFFQIYNSQFKKKVNGKLQINKMDKIIGKLNKSDKIEFFEKKFNLKIYEKFFKKNINVIFEKMEIFSENKLVEVFKIYNQIGILQKNILNEILVINKYKYFFELNFSVQDKINSSFVPINLERNYSCNFLVKLKCLEKLGTLDFKISLEKIIEISKFEKKNFYNLSDLYKLAIFFMKNFETIWNSFGKEIKKDKFYNFLTKKSLKRIFFSPFHQKNEFLKLQKKVFYPRILLRKILTIKPKKILIIFLMNKNTIKIILYHVKLKRHDISYYNINDVMGVFDNIQKLLDLKFFDKAGKRIFDIIRNSLILKNNG